MRFFPASASGSESALLIYVPGPSSLWHAPCFSSAHEEAIEAQGNIMLHHSVHRNTRMLLRSWKDIARSGEADIASGNTEIVNGLFLLRRVAPETFVFRLAGATLERLVGTDLINKDFSSLWHVSDRRMLDDVVNAALHGQGPALIHACGAAGMDGGIQIEIMIAPLDQTKSTYPRLLGHYQPYSPENVLKGRSIAVHRLVSLHLPASHADFPPLRLAARS